jgi:hypothetical protein
MLIDEADDSFGPTFEVEWRHRIHEFFKAAITIPVLHRLLSDLSD